MLAFAFAMIWVGVLLGSLVATPEGVTGIGFVVLFPLTFVASTFVPTESMPRRAADDRRVEPGHDAVRRDPGPVRQPAHAAGRRRPLVDRPPGRLHAHLVVGIVAVCAPLAVRAYDRSIAK